MCAMGSEESSAIKDQKLSRLEEENTRLKRAVEELTILNDLASSIGALQDSQEIMQNIIRRSLRAVDAAQGVITLVDEEKEDSEDAMRTLVRSMVSSADQQPFHLHQNLLGWMHLNRKPLRISDPKNDFRFHGVKWDEGISNILCVPLMIKSKLIGILTVYNKKTAEEFSEEDQRLLAIIAAQSAQIVENARLHEEEKSYLRLQHEMEVAGSIQRKLLPDEFPQIPGYEIAGKSVPAQTVGGDYFDFIQLDERHLAFCLADVSGKGVSAALLMANLQATLRGLAENTTSPGDCLTRANKLLCHSIETGRFITCFYGIIDTEEHKLSYCNAGHDKPFMFSSPEESERLFTDCLILGLMEESSYTDETFTMREGNVLVVYSDGVTDAVDKDENYFGEERLQKVIRENLSESASRIIEAISQEVESFIGECDAIDDLTLVVIKRDSP